MNSEELVVANDTIMGFVVGRYFNAMTDAWDDFYRRGGIIDETTGIPVIPNADETGRVRVSDRLDAERQRVVTVIGIEEANKVAEAARAFAEGNLGEWMAEREE
jgi:hypothetical protein